MTDFLELLSLPGKIMQKAIRHDVVNLGNDKIITDLNGSATVNMKNPQVRDAMRARMEELARKRQR